MYVLACTEGESSAIIPNSAIEESRNKGTGLVCP